VVTGLLFSTKTWTKTMDSKQPLDIIYLGFSKAFDKVPHDLLLIKLRLQDSAAFMDAYFVGLEHSWQIVRFVFDW
jgi:hypothetical protein